MIYTDHDKQEFARMKKRGFPAPDYKLERKLARAYKETFIKATQSLIDEITTDSPFAFLRNWLLDIIDFNPNEIQTIRNRLTETQINIDATEFLSIFNQALGSQLEQMLNILQTDSYKFADEFERKVTLQSAEVWQYKLNSLIKNYQEIASEIVEEIPTIIREKLDEALFLFVTDKTKKSRQYLNKVLKTVAKISTGKAKFAVRDTLAKFNKAVAITGFEAVGVKQVEWLTCNDARVRPTHRALNHTKHYIHAIPKEAKDFNCRCGLVPVWE